MWDIFVIGGHSAVPSPRVQVVTIVAKSNRHIPWNGQAQNRHISSTGQTHNRRLPCTGQTQNEEIGEGGGRGGKGGCGGRLQD